jgi:dihydropteroate synthase
MGHRRGGGEVEQVGVKQIVVDPGFGFGKTVTQNLRLIASVGTLLELGRPVMIGISRKSSIGAVLGTLDDPVPVQERLYGTLGATAAGVLAGASIVRTHDVRPTVEMLKVISSVRAAADRLETGP